MKQESIDKFFRELGKRVRKVRQDKKMTQEDMLEHGFSTRHYQHIEAGKPITMTTALRLCKVLGVKLSKLIKGID